MLTNTQVVALGGVDALRNSGAFDRVSEVGDCVFLRATPTISHYDDAAVERVWAVLHSQLPHEWPHPHRFSNDLVLRLVMRPPETVDE